VLTGNLILLRRDQHPLRPSEEMAQKPRKIMRSTSLRTHRFCEQ
jgi:hypothetical protein